MKIWNRVKEVLPVVGILGVLGYFEWGSGNYAFFGGVVEVSPLFPVGLILTAPMVLWLAKAVMPPTHKITSPHYLVLWSFVLLAYTPWSMVAVGWANRTIDEVGPVAVEARIVSIEKSTSARGGTSYEIWGRAQQYPELVYPFRISERKGSTYREGEPIEMMVGEGLFGLTYVAGFKRPD